ncbi:MAG: hypothetical protein AMXMBFR84_22960 [Candidatus Hydrogenedentota bacterium]
MELDGRFNRREALAAAIAMGLAGSVKAQKTEEPAMTTLVYRSVDTVDIQVDVYGSGRSGPRPALMWIHGGGLITGSRGSIFKSVRSVCQESGYVLASFDYRLGPEVKVPAILDDIAAGYRWLIEQGPDVAGVDASRVAVAGTSAGGYLTLTTGYRVVPRPKALVSYWGYGDIAGDWYSKPSEHYRTASPLVDRDTALSAVNKGVLTKVEGEIGKGRGTYYLYLRQNGLWTQEMTGLDPNTDQAKLAALCPVQNVGSDYPPTMLVHGTNDTDVPYDQSKSMAEALAAMAIPHELVTVEGGGHGLTGVDAAEVESAHRRAQAFIRSHLGD